MPKPLTLFALAFVCACLLLDRDARADDPAPFVPPAPPAPSWPTPPRAAPLQTSPAAAPTASLPMLPTESSPLDDSDEHVTRVLATGETPPAGYRPVVEPNWRLFKAGIWTLAGSYTATATFGELGCALEGCGGSGVSGDLLVPALGPFLVMARTSHVAANVFFASDGLAQLSGIAMMATSFVFKREVFVLDAGRPTLTVAPLLRRGSPGLAVLGTF